MVKSWETIEYVVRNIVTIPRKSISCFYEPLYLQSIIYLSVLIYSCYYLFFS